MMIPGFLLDVVAPPRGLRDWFLGPLHFRPEYIAARSRLVLTASRGCLCRSCVVFGVRVGFGYGGETWVAGWGIISSCRFFKFYFYIFFQKIRPCANIFSRTSENEIIMLMRDAHRARQK